MTGRWERLDTQKIALGLALATIGVIALSGQFEMRDVWKLWPLGFGVIALGKLSAHPSRGVFAEGVVLLALCLGFLAINFRWFGMRWRDSWPLIIVINGLWLVVTSFARKAQTGVPGRATAGKEDQS